MPALTFEQFELITDDPRLESEGSAFAELREYWRATKELGGLLTQSQAARILGVHSAQINQWIRSGRLSTREISGVRMVSASEVTLLHAERSQGIRAAGGRGLKAPSLAGLVRDARTDLVD